MATQNVETWTTEKEDELIILWSSRPSLFNTTLPSYRDRVEKDVLTREIATKLGLTVQPVNTRMKSLRTQYCKLLRQPPSGSAAKPLTGKNRWIVDRLQFLKAFMGNKCTQSNFQLQDDQTLEQLDQSDEDDENQIDILDGGDGSDGFDGSLSPSPAWPERPERPTPRSTKRPLSTPRVQGRIIKKKKEDQEVQLLDGLTRFIDNETKPKQSNEKEKTDSDAFGEYVGKSLSKMDKRTQSIVKNRIQNVIFQAEMGTLQPPPPPQSQSEPPYQENWPPSSVRDRQPLFSVLHDSMNMYNQQ